MADDVIDRRADTFREALESEAGRDSGALCDIFIRRMIQRLRVHPRFNQLLHEIEYAVIHKRSAAYPLNIRLVVDNPARRTHLSFDNIIMYGCNPLVKICMTFLVFFSAAAPARIVSIHCFAPYFSYRFTFIIARNIIFIKVFSLHTVTPPAKP